MQGDVACDVTPSPGEPPVAVDNGPSSTITVDLNEIDLGQNCAPSGNSDEMNYRNIESVSSPLSARRRPERPHKPVSYKLTTTGTLVECKTSAITCTSAEHRQTGQCDQLANFAKTRKLSRIPGYP